MSLIGTTQGNLFIKELNRVDNKKYSYPVYYYTCLCNLCNKEVALPQTNIRNYTDCGKHRKEKVSKQYPYKDTHLTMDGIMRKSKKSYSYIAKLLREGKSVDSIISKKKS